VLFVFIIVVVSLGGGGGGGEENKEGTSGGTASTDGQIVFRRWLDPEGGHNLAHTKSAIFTMYPNGSHIRQITHPPEGFSDGSPVWSPDGTKVAFYRQAIDESTSRIMVLNTKTGDARQVVRGVEGFDPAFSPDGHSLAFKRIDGIWIVGLDGSGLHQETNEHPNRAVAFSDSWPQFSPDGKMLVFERTRLEDDHSAVFVQSLDSSASPEDARQITPWEMGCEDGPEFSPNGDWVLFSCEGEGGSSNLYWVHPDGTGLDRLTGSGPAVEGLNSLDYYVDYVGSSFSPEFHEGWGDIVAARYPAYGDEGNSDVFGMRIESGAHMTVNLTKSQTLDDAPSWGTPEGAR
jgi:Tol biopolymer transport system component